jgi:hypothetical protein
VSLVAWGQAAAQSDAGRQRLDRVVASIAGDAITERQLEFETRVIFIYEGGVRAATATLDQQALGVGLAEVIADSVAVAEAKRIDAYTLEPGELDGALVRFREQIADEALNQLLLSADADMGDVRRVLERRLRATRVWDSRLRLKAQVSEVDLRKYKETHPEAKDLSPDALRRVLYRRRYDELKAIELKAARRQYDVRLRVSSAPVP